MRYVMLTVFVSLFVASVALAEGTSKSRYPMLEKSQKHIGKNHCKKYNGLHAWAVNQFGKKTVGRNVCKFGMPKKGGGNRPPTKAEFTETMAVLDRWKNPAPVLVAATSYEPQATTSYGGGGCTGMGAESGSAGYGAYNPAGPGYIGCYQIASGHYAAGGSCAGLGTDPAGQDACAGIICRTEGAGAWTNSAGQNPCGRLP